MKILTLAFNDLLRSFRSLFAIGMMVAAPLLITGLIYAAFGGISSGQADLPVTKVVVVNADEPPPGQPAFGQAVVDMLGDPSVSKWLQVSLAAGETSARAAVDRQEAGVAVLIPPGFSSSILEGGSRASLTILQDPTLTTGPNVVREMLGSLIDGATGAKVAFAQFSNVQPGGQDPQAAWTLVNRYQDWFIDFQRTLFHSPQAALAVVAPSLGMQGTIGAGTTPENPMRRMLALIMAGQMIFFAFYTGAYSMMSVLRDEEEGTLARLFTTPTSRTLILSGKFLAVVLAVIVQALVLIAFGGLVFKISWGQPQSVFLALLGQVVAATGLGALLIAFVKNTRQGGTVLGGVLSVFGMLGGLFTVGAPSLPAGLEAISRFTPHGWALQAWKLSLAGAPPAELVGPCLVLLAIGVSLFAAGAYRFNRRFA